MAGYKAAVVEAQAEDTRYTKLFDLEWPDVAHRVLRNRVVREWEAAGSPPSGGRPGEGEVVGRMPVAGGMVELTRYGIFMPMEGFEGDLEDQALYCGESCSLVREIMPAADIVRTLVEGAGAIMNGKARKYET